MTRAPGFTGGRIVRPADHRDDPEAFAAALGDWRARLLRMGGYEPAITDDGRLDWGMVSEAPDDALIVLLGLEDGRPRFAAAPDGIAAGPLRSPALMNALAALQPGEAATYATARSVLDWNARHRFCANCGTMTRSFRAGWARKCDACGAEHFPRVDPVVIMLAEHDGRALLGRQRPWPAGRYSALAGFLEPGEAIEEAVAREIREEAGVIVGNVRYVASQPWPFPSQLMIACVAEAADDRLTVDTNELEDAMWVSREDVRAALDGRDAPFVAPPRYAIAWTLLDHWARQG